MSNSKDAEYPSFQFWYLFRYSQDLTLVWCDPLPCQRSIPNFRPRRKYVLARESVQDSKICEGVFCERTENLQNGFEICNSSTSIGLETHGIDNTLSNVGAHYITKPIASLRFYYWYSV